jgi:hypothetical protein
MVRQGLFQYVAGSIKTVKLADVARKDLIQYFNCISRGSQMTYQFDQLPLHLLPSDNIYYIRRVLQTEMSVKHCFKMILVT